MYAAQKPNQTDRRQLATKSAPQPKPPAKLVAAPVVEAAPIEDTTTADIWRAGGLDERRACLFLSISDRAFRTIRKQQAWPRKRIRGTAKIVYPRSVLRAFLAACEDA